MHPQTCSQPASQPTGQPASRPCPSIHSFIQPSINPCGCTCAHTMLCAAVETMDERHFGAGTTFGELSSGTCFLEPYRGRFHVMA